MPWQVSQGERGGTGWPCEPPQGEWEVSRLNREEWESVRAQPREAHWHQHLWWFPRGLLGDSGAGKLSGTRSPRSMGVSGSSAAPLASPPAQTLGLPGMQMTPWMTAMLLRARGPWGTR